MSRDEIIKLAANGNAKAEEFLRDYADHAHYVDDLKDQDKVIDIPAQEARWLICISSNPFFDQHKAMLVPLMLCGLNAWADSHNFRGVERDVVKGVWHEVVYAVAMITGGWAHMRRVSAHREYDIQDQSIHTWAPHESECSKCGTPVGPGTLKEAANGLVR